MANNMIVLDLDETLVHVFYEDGIEHPLWNDRRLADRLFGLNLPDGQFYWGVTRPHLFEFLDFCFDHFKAVAIWSAGTFDYVHSVLDVILRGRRDPHFIFTRNDCDYSKDGNTVKPLAKFPLIGKYVVMKDIAAVDDLETNFIENPENGIVIPPYKPRPEYEEIMQEDNVLPNLIEWFKKHPGNYLLADKPYAK